MKLLKSVAALLLVPALASEESLSLLQLNSAAVTKPVQPVSGGTQLAANAWFNAHSELPEDARVDRGTFVKTCKALAPESFNDKDQDFSAYLNDVFDLGLAMMLPSQKNDLGRHCFSYGFIMSKEFYGNKPSDVLGLLNGASKNLDKDWKAVAKDASGRVTSAAFNEVAYNKYRSKLTSANQEAFQQYTNKAFQVGLSMMRPASKTTLGGHCFRYSMMMVGEFYFGDSGDDRFDFVPDPAPSVGATIAAGGWETAHTNLPPNARVDRDVFIATCNAAAPTSFKEMQLPFEQYLNDIFDLGLAMMLPRKKNNLGRHCFSYGFLLSKEFYGDVPTDSLSLTKGANSDLDRDWAAVAKDSSGRVTKAAFKSAMVKKHAPKLTESNSAYFDQYLEQCFKVGLSMMLPNEKTTLGGHCFRYSAMAAGEFYFDGDGADALKFVPKQSKPRGALAATIGWNAAHANLAPTARVDRDNFIQTCKAAAPTQFNEQSKYYDVYLNDIFDLGTAMMLPRQKEDLGRHCFSYGFLLSKEFYGEVPMDLMGFTKGSSKILDADWSKVTKDRNGRVTQDAFKTLMKTKHQSLLTEENREAFDMYLDQCFKVGLSMMLPDRKSTLGGHCFRYASMAAGEFYFNGKGRDVLGIAPKRSKR